MLLNEFYLKSFVNFFVVSAFLLLLLCFVFQENQDSAQEIVENEQKTQEHETKKPKEHETKTEPIQIFQQEKQNLERHQTSSPKQQTPPIQLDQTTISPRRPPVILSPTLTEQLQTDSKSLVKISQNDKKPPPKRFIRIFGHMDYVYCVCFDRTGQYIFTVSFCFKIIYLQYNNKNLTICVILNILKQIQQKRIIIFI